MFTLAQMKIITSLARAIQEWIAQINSDDDWDSVSGWIGDDLDMRMALVALMPVFQSRADQDYLRKERMLKE